MSVSWKSREAGDSPFTAMGANRLAANSSASRRYTAAFVCLIGARIMRATIKKLGRSAGRQRGDKSDDIINIVTFGQRGRKPRHLGPIKVVRVGATNTLEIALIGRL